MLNKIALYNTESTLHVSKSWTCSTSGYV